MRIGVIADTHGKLLPEVFQAFHGVSMILHAGDIGSEQVIIELEIIARVVAVRGNTDTDLRPPEYPDTRRMTLAGVDIFLCHEPARAFGLTPPPDVIIHGHTHAPLNERRDGVLWLNPGTASKPQFTRRACTVALLDVHDGAAQADIITLREG